MAQPANQSPWLVQDAPPADAPKLTQGVPSTQDLLSRSGDASLLEEVRRMRILVVDDIPTNLALLRAMLESGGFCDVVCAQSGREALKYLTESSRDQADVGVILLDIVMPDVDGYSLCRELRSHSEWADIPVIMITAHERWQEQTVHLAYENGATDIMFRPFRSTELLPRIISALSLKRERSLRKRREQELETELTERGIIEARLHYLVVHDDLTGLYNRRHLEQALERAIHNAAEKQKTGALLYIDLDQFKVINDCEGHAAGDRLLIKVANTLRRHLRTTDVLARIGSDEFGLLIEHASEASALQVAEALRGSINGFRYDINGKTYHIGVSIGVAMISHRENITASGTLARADHACFTAKSRGRNMVHLYDHDDTEMLTLQNNAHWVPRIREALTKKRFVLAFQPVLRIADNTIQRFEALLRMIDDDGSLIQPGEFIVVAERMGLIHDIDHWVVGNAIDALAKLPPEQSDVCLNINLSGHSFQNSSLVPLVQEKLHSTGVAADRLTFEITETAAIANFTRMRAMVDDLRALGCQFALDDFGAGFNSYNCLKLLPVDYLKIDGTFIAGLTSDSVDQALVRSVVEIAHTLGKKTVAEFVADRKTLELLRSYGVDYAQGYFIGKPGREMKKS